MMLIVFLFIIVEEQEHIGRSTSFSSLGVKLKRRPTLFNMSYNCIAFQQNSVQKSSKEPLVPINLWKELTCLEQSRVAFFTSQVETAAYDEYARHSSLILGRWRQTSDVVNRSHDVLYFLS